jgi:hypothetical protein
MVIENLLVHIHSDTCVEVNENMTHIIGGLLIYLNM